VELFSSARSEKSFSTGARTNPLYGGGAGAGSRTPSWANKGTAPRSSALQRGRLLPPDSPGRERALLASPSTMTTCTHVPRTPGPGYGPVHRRRASLQAAPLLRSGPLRSLRCTEQGDHSPFSSAPPSPHSIANTTPFDARSTR